MFILQSTGTLGPGLGSLAHLRDSHHRCLWRPTHLIAGPQYATVGSKLATIIATAITCEISIEAGSKRSGFSRRMCPGNGAAFALGPCMRRATAPDYETGIRIHLERHIGPGIELYYNYAHSNENSGPWKLTSRRSLRKSLSVTRCIDGLHARFRCISSLTPRGLSGGIAAKLIVVVRPEGRILGSGVQIKPFTAIQDLGGRGLWTLAVDPPGGQVENLEIANCPGVLMHSTMERVFLGRS